MNLQTGKVVLEKTKDLIPHPKNPNQHSDGQVERLALLIKEHGWRVPIIVSNRSGHIVSGHGRLLAAKKNGWEQVPVVRQDFDSEESEYAFLVSDNAIASWAELDLSSINMSIAELGPDFDLDHLGIKNFKLDPSELAIDIKEPGLGAEPPTNQCPNCGHILK